MEAELRQWSSRYMYSLASHTYFEEVGVVASRMVTLARFPCAAGIHYRHDVRLITDNRRCEECIAMARACLLALASV